MEDYRETFKKIVKEAAARLALEDSIEQSGGLDMPVNAFIFYLLKHGVRASVIIDTLMDEELNQKMNEINEKQKKE